MKKRKEYAAAIVDLTQKADACTKMAAIERKSADSIHWNARKLEELSDEIVNIAAALENET